MAKGLTTKEALKIKPHFLRKATEKQLSKIVSAIRSTARKRYERLIESEEYSPAASSLVKSAKGKGDILPSVKGMDKTQLLNEYKRLSAFLKMQSSTVTGAKQVKEHVRIRASEIVGRELTDAETTEMWRIVDQLQKEDAIGMSRTHGDTNGAEVAEYVGKLITSDLDLSREDILQMARDKAQQIYERKQMESMPYGDNTSQFFDEDSY